MCCDLFLFNRPLKNLTFSVVIYKNHFFFSFTKKKLAIGFFFALALVSGSGPELREARREVLVFQHKKTPSRQYGPSPDIGKIVGKLFNFILHTDRAVSLIGEVQNRAKTATFVTTLSNNEVKNRDSGRRLETK